MSADTSVVIVKIAKNDFRLGIVQAAENLVDDTAPARWHAVGYFLRQEDNEKHASMEAALTAIPDRIKKEEDAGFIIEYPDPLVLELLPAAGDVREMEVKKTYRVA